MTTLERLYAALAGVLYRAAQRRAAGQQQGIAGYEFFRDATLRRAGSSLHAPSKSSDRDEPCQADGPNQQP